MGEWAASSAAFLVYGDFGPLETADGESFWGRRVIDDNFRFVGTNELAVVAGPTEMPALMRGATSLLQQTLPGAYGECADDATSHIDDETLNAEAHEALESAVQALGFYTCAVKEARRSLAPAEPLPKLIENLTAAQARVNALVTKTIEEARAAALAAAAAPAAPPAHAARSPSRGRLPTEGSAVPLPVQQPLLRAHCAVRPLRHQGQGVHLGSVQWGPANMHVMAGGGQCALLCMPRPLYDPLVLREVLQRQPHLRSAR